LTPRSGRLRSTLDERQILSRQSDKVVPSQAIAAVPNQTIVPKRGSRQRAWARETGDTAERRIETSCVSQCGDDAPRVHPLAPSGPDD
jgi:hypothetical protein